jgi:hypothetical protein
VVSTLASYLDSDPAHLRQGLVHRTGVELRVEEDLTLDPETEHGPEEITWLALDQGDLLKASPADLAPYPLLIRPDYTRTNRWSAVEILVLENDPDRQHQEDVRVKWPTHPVDTPPQFGNAFCVAPHPTVVGSSVEGFCKKIRYSSGQQLGTDTFSYRAWGRVGEAGPTLVTVEVTEDGPLDLLHEPFQSLAGWVVRHQTSTGTASWSVGEVVAADPPKEGAGSIAAASTACPPTRSDAPLVLQRGDMRPAPGHPDLPRPGTYLVWQGGGGWGDQEIRLKLGSAQERGDIGVMFRYNDSQNFYRVSWDLATGRARIVRRKNGFYTLLAEGTHRLGIGQGVLNPIRISMVGSDIAVGYDHPPDCVPIKAPDPDLVASDPGGFAVGSVALYTSNNAGFFADDVDVTQVFP